MSPLEMELAGTVVCRASAAAAAEAEEELICGPQSTSVSGPASLTLILGSQSIAVRLLFRESPSRAAAGAGGEAAAAGSWFIGSVAKAAGLIRGVELRWIKCLRSLSLIINAEIGLLHDWMNILRSLGEGKLNSLKLFSPNSV